MTLSNSVRAFSVVLTFGLALAPVAAQAPAEVVRVTSKAVERQVKLPGEFRPYLAVSLYAKVAGFVRRVDVDRGSAVRQGQLLATLSPARRCSSV